MLYGLHSSETVMTKHARTCKRDTVQHFLHEQQGHGDRAPHIVADVLTDAGWFWVHCVLCVL